ncbi:MAG: hypothetical protein CL912_20925 [Deltaproteobacteria bacterium]|nr:hypothetical protein [Deltaproteobacteria bacterium]
MYVMIKLSELKDGSEVVGCSENSELRESTRDIWPRGKLSKEAYLRCDMIILIDQTEARMKRVVYGCC